VFSLANTSDDLSNGDLSNNDLSDGNSSDNNLSDGNSSNNNLINGNLSNNDLSNGDSSDGDLSNGDLSNGNLSGDDDSSDNEGDSYLPPGYPQSQSQETSEAVDKQNLHIMAPLNIPDIHSPTNSSIDEFSDEGDLDKDSEVANIDPRLRPAKQWCVVSIHCSLTATW